MFRYGEMFENLTNIKENPHLGKMKPFKIVGGVYFAGTYQASCHIIDTGAGLILIDPGYSSTLYLVINSIYELGFKPSDIKYIINTHWHFDHVEATKALADLSGAITLIGRDDAEKALQFFTPDILVDDGYVLTLGNTKIEFMITPGHTKGTLSFFFNTSEDGKIYRVGMFGGAGVNTLEKSHRFYDFDGCQEAFVASVERLEKEKVDVFIGNHCWNNGTYEKAKKLLSVGINEFLDCKIWGDFLASCKSRALDMIKQGK